MAHHIPLNNAPYAALIDYKEFVNLFQIRENYSTIIRFKNLFI